MKSIRRLSAFTLAEVMIASAVGALAMAAAFSGAISIQRCVVASEEFAADKREQTRLNDYLALDLRRALTIKGPVDNVLLTLTIPDFYGADGKPQEPTITKTPDFTYVTSYGTTPVTVVYRKHKKFITRTVNEGKPLIVATNVEDFQCAIDNIGASNYVQTRITFLPSFATPSEAKRAATTVHNTIRLRNLP